ncbi:MAG TPA: LamG domain-containing protein [Candidatus Angelobacter sp.]|nr:LamG domain-containing protein [Candidatus Angelobacter sp.]
MKTKPIIQFVGISVSVFCFALAAYAQNSNLTPEQQAARRKEKLTKALNNAIRDFQNYNDQDTLDFASGMLKSLDRPNGTAPAALMADGAKMRSRVRQLIQRGALESASSLNWAQLQIMQGLKPGERGPANPKIKTSGPPGPGGLVLYFSFDTPADNGIVHDESGTGNDGHVAGAQWTADGRFGGAYEFHITNITDRIVVPNSDTLNPDYITVSAWIKAADRDGFWNRIADKDYRFGYCLDLGGDTDSRAARGRLQAESSVGYVQSDRVLNDDKWHFVAMSYDGKVQHCYVDGVEKSRPVRRPGPLKKNGWDLCIGNSVVDYDTGEFLGFEGLIDEVRIYNRALSAAEIKALANGTHAGVDVLPSPETATGGNASDPVERIKKLDALFQQGLISKDEYDKKKKEILDSL